MPTTFAQALTARGLAAADVAAAELRAKNQGGGVETAALELGLLTQAQAIELVVELSRLPRAPSDLVGQLSPASAALFPRKLAERHGMVPLGLQRRQLQLLVRHPVDLSQIDEIGFLLSRTLKLFVGIDLEIAEAMKVVYGIPIPGRLEELRKKVGPPPAAPAAAPEASTRPQALVLKAPEPAPAPVAPAPAPLAPPVSSPSSPGLVAPALAAWAPGPGPSLALALPKVTEPKPVAILLGAPPAPGGTPSIAPSEPTAPAPAIAPVPPPPSAKPGVAPAPESSVRVEVAAVPPAAPARAPEPAEPVEPTKPVEPTESAERAEPAAATPVAPAPGATLAPVDTDVDRSSKVFWDEAGDLLSLKPRTPVLPEPSGVAPVSEPAAEPSPFEAAPIEAQPLTSGFAGRAGFERRISVAEALASLRQQPSRDGIIGTAISYLRGAFDFVAIFTRHGDTFRVFEASGVDYGGGADLGQTVVDLDRSRVLRTVVEGRAPYVGQVPPGDPLESALGAVGRARLRAVLLYPVVIRDRTVAVVHGDRGGEALAPRQLSDVALVLSQLGAQLERVLRERRRAASQAEPAAAEPPAARPPLPLRVVQVPSTAAPVSPPPIPLRVPMAEPVAEAAASEALAAAAPLPLKLEAAPEVPAASPPSYDDEVALHAAVLADQEPFEVPVDWVDVDAGSSFADQVRAFLSGDPPARAKAAEILRGGGADAAWALAERFPGPLFVFRMNIDELPGPDGIGPVLGLMAAIGVEAIPALLQLADAQGEERRFWATVLLAKFGDRKAIDVLARRLLDASPDVALAARRGLYRLRGEPEFASVLDRVTAELTNTSNPERLTAIIRALGQFHHVPAIPRLITLVGIRDPQISTAAADALRELTRQDFGAVERRWASWWHEAKDRPRLHWLIEALESRNRDLRLAAISELTEVAGLDFGFRSDIEPLKQEGALGRWREWWEREGHLRAVAPPPAA